MSDIDVTGTLLPAMIMAAIAAWLVVPATARTRTQARKPPPAWLAPRPGAPASHIRVLAGLVAACAVLIGVPWPFPAAAGFIRSCGNGDVVGVWPALVIGA
ncbi:hypothetical protein [Cutibacterium acnes]|uniref:hypothetical protein n=1 Tax=Cutibacterium acnes TaxID=1747 RepID=UPI0001F0996F|nr:hypothetical protein [Cutibacterium acnes]EFT03221.1 hypothetical protein HMPREF9613_00634 [Cutibacterium acnes HL002PA1]